MGEPNHLNTLSYPTNHTPSHIILITRPLISIPHTLSRRARWSSSVCHTPSHILLTTHPLLSFHSHTHSRRARWSSSVCHTPSHILLTTHTLSYLTTHPPFISYHSRTLSDVRGGRALSAIAINESRLCKKLAINTSQLGKSALS